MNQDLHLLDFEPLLKDSAVLNRLMVLATSTPAVESAWLAALATLERNAAHQIRQNISPHSPRVDIDAILSHAADEDRHADQILAMRPVTSAQDSKHRELESKLCHLAQQFITAFFGNHELAAAKNKHSAYVHGALTIELFPFRIYSVYLKFSKLPRVLANLPLILKDEHEHLALGKKLLRALNPEDRLSTTRLRKIESDLCNRMALRMETVIQNFLHPIAKKEDFESVLYDSSDLAIAWAFALSKAEKNAAQEIIDVYQKNEVEPEPETAEHLQDELRHSKMISRSIALERRSRMLASNDGTNNDGSGHSGPGHSYAGLERLCLRAMHLYQKRVFSMAQSNDLSAMERYSIVSFLLETRVLRHYKSLSASTAHIGLSHVLATILEDERRHVRSFTKKINAQFQDASFLRSLLAQEEILWKQMTSSLIKRSARKSVATISKFNSDEPQVKCKMETA